MKSGLLSKYFPLPKFLNPRHIGISFSDSAIKAVSLERSASRPQLKSSIIPLEKGVIVDGKILQDKEVVQKISSLREIFNSPFAFLAIPDELAYLFTTVTPVTKGGNALESIAFTIEENVPLSFSETIFDFAPIEIVKTETKYRGKMVVSVCVKREVEKFVEVVKRGGFEAVGCIHESQAIGNAVIPEGFIGASHIIHARRDRIGIYLALNNLVHFSTLRSVSEGSYKNHFLDEYGKFLEYSLRYNAVDREPVKTVFVCGEFECAKKIVEAVVHEYNAAQNTKLSNVWVNVLKIEKNTPSISYEDSLNLAGPVGAVLSDIM